MTWVLLAHSGTFLTHTRNSHSHQSIMDIYAVRLTVRDNYACVKSRSCWVRQIENVDRPLDGVDDKRTV